MAKKKNKIEPVVIETEIKARCSDCGHEFLLTELSFLPTTEAGFKAYSAALEKNEEAHFPEFKNNDIRQEPLLCEDCLKKLAEELSQS